MQEINMGFILIMVLCLANAIVGVIDIVKHVCIYVPKVSYTDASMEKFSQTSGMIEILLSLGIVVMTLGSYDIFGGQMAVYAGGGLAVLMLLMYLVLKNRTLVRR